MFEFVDHTVLDDLERNPHGLDETRCKKILWQVLKGTEFCHNHNVSMSIKFLAAIYVRLYLLQKYFNNLFSFGAFIQDYESHFFLRQARARQKQTGRPMIWKLAWVLECCLHKQENGVRIFQVSNFFCANFEVFSTSLHYIKTTFSFSMSGLHSVIFNDVSKIIWNCLSCQILFPVLPSSLWVYVFWRTTVGVKVLISVKSIKMQKQYWIIALQAFNNTLWKLNIRTFFHEVSSVICSV